MDTNSNITFSLEDGSEIILEVLEQTTINGINYLLVIEETEDAEEALILREEQTQEDDVIYIPVEDDNELDALSKVFAELLEDIKFEK